MVGRTAPNHSWRNPVEKTMSVIKLGLQCVGTNATQGQLRVRKECQQPECSARSHKVMKSAPSTPSVAFEQHNNLKQEPFSLFKGTSDNEMQAFWEVVHLVDESLDQSDTRKSTLQKKPNLQAFSLITAVKSIFV